MNLHDLADRIKNGDPVSGWEGDPRLTLALYTDPKNPINQTYELWRQEGEGYSLVAKLRGGLDPYTILPELVKRDQRRGLDIREAVDRHNAKVQAAKDAASSERSFDAAERIVWALRKDGAL